MPKQDKKAIRNISVNLFLTSDPILYPLKAPENIWFFLCCLVARRVKACLSGVKQFERVDYIIEI